MKVFLALLIVVLIELSRVAFKAIQGELEVDLKKKTTSNLMFFKACFYALLGIAYFVFKMVLLYLGAYSLL